MPESAATSLRGNRGPSQAEVESWLGWRVDDLNGCMIGHVESVIGDGVGGVAWLVVAEFRIGDGRRFLVPAYDAVGEAGRVWSPHDRRRVRDSVRVLGGGGFSSEADRGLRAHYASSRRRAA